MGFFGSKLKEQHQQVDEGKECRKIGPNATNYLICCGYHISRLQFIMSQSAFVASELKGGQVVGQALLLVLGRPAADGA